MRGRQPLGPSENQVTLEEATVSFTTIPSELSLNRMLEDDIYTGTQRYSIVAALFAHDM